MSEKSVEHNRENSWFDGEKWIPVENLTNTHLRRAKLFAQKKEEYHFYKSGEFSDMVDMLEAEAARRGLKIKDYRSKFRRNTRRMKEATRVENENKTNADL